MQISFYVLSDAYIKRAIHTKAQLGGLVPAAPHLNHETSINAASGGGTACANSNSREAVLDFVCQLTQTVLKKSPHSLVIVDDILERLHQLDSHLWAFDPVSFVPHTLVSTPAAALDAAAAVIPDTQTVRSTATDLSAPVTLRTELPPSFKGVVLNLASAPLPISTHSTVTLPARVLEIISPDKASIDKGRDKYGYYRQQGFALKHIPMN